MRNSIWVRRYLHDSTNLFNHTIFHMLFLFQHIL